MIQSQNPVICVNSRNLARWLYLVTATLSLLHIAILVLYFWIDDRDVFDFVRLIDLDYEANIPTLFSAMLFFIVFLLLLLVWQGETDNSGGEQGKKQWQWLGLALIFLFLGFDEGVKLHEHLGDYMEQFVEADGFLYFPWFIPYISIFILLMFLYLPFYLRLPLRTRKYFLAAAVVYLTGAALLDIISAREADINGTRTIYYSVVYTVEEILEMIGLIIFIRALIDLLGERQVVVGFR